jgi:hypothetical protein
LRGSEQCALPDFSLFSTPPSLWTLETVSGSSQFVPTGQSFQPLVIRVTDGSLAANPVMGVNVTFETTLARVSHDQGGQQDGDSNVGGNGMPVLLGSSQAQVGSTQDGLASIVPSVGSVGPCDVFITVSAGSSSAQFQMESLAAIVSDQPQNNRPKAPIAPRDPHFVPNFVSQTSAPQGVPNLLFAVPQGTPLEDPVASQSPCSDARQDTASSTDSSFGAPGTPGTGDVVSWSCESASELPHVDVEALRPPAEPSAKPPADSTERDNGGGAARQPPKTPSANHSSANDPSANHPPADNPEVGSPPESRLLEDKRSCRFAQSEDGVFFGTTLGVLP